MKSTARLILILAGFTLLCFFQNFELPRDPNYHFDEEKRFASNETDPLRRLGDYIEFNTSDEAKEKLKFLEGEFQWGSPSLNNSQEETSDSHPSLEDEKSNKKDPFKYGILNANTVRFRNSKDQFNCSFVTKGVNLKWQRQMSSTSSYVLEHNTSENKSQAKIQWTW